MPVRDASTSFVLFTTHMATPYGNYRAYYPRRRARSSLAPDRDERLALLPQGWFAGKRVLDIGCNVGEVTVEAGAWAVGIVVPAKVLADRTGIPHQPSG